MERATRVLLASFLTVASVSGIGNPTRAAAAQVLLSDGFHGATTSNPIVPLDNAHPTTSWPCLTAGTDSSSVPVAGCGSPADSPGTGVLRLTDNENDEDAGVVYQPGLSLAQGLSAEFKMYMYGGNGADGISFDLAAAPPNPTALGARGGALGYSTLEADPGLPAGWLGFGFDTWGNYARSVVDSASCNPHSGASMVPNAVSVRGPGNGTTGYCLLSTTGSLTSFNLGGSDRAGAARGVKIVVDPSANTFTVGIDSTGGTNYTTVLSGTLPTSYYDQAGAVHSGMPAQVTFVFAGATGAVNDFHEISDVVATTLTSPPPPARQPVPSSEIHHNDHAGSNDPNPNTNPSADTLIATIANPTVSTSCPHSCSLKAVTSDEYVLIDAADTGTGGAPYTAASVGPASTPVFSLTIDGGGAKPSCPGYRPRDRNWVQFGFASGGSTYRKTGNVTPIVGVSRSEAESRLGRDQVCFSAPYRFAPRSGFRLRHVGGWFDAVLPDCAAAVRGPCVTDRAVVRVGDGWGVRLDFWVPPGRKDPKALG